jgi:formate dehydrogenase major subunit
MKAWWTEEFITTRASNFEALRDNVKAYSLDDGTTSAVPATMREVAREFAKAKGDDFVGHGHQHVGTTTPAASLPKSP